MKLFTRIVVNILPLILVPLVLVTALTISRGNRIIRDLAVRNAELELDFFLAKCAEEAKILEDLGLSNIDFYKENAVDSLIDYAENRIIPGAELYIKSNDKPLLGGSEIPEGTISMQETFSPWDWTVGIAVSKDYLETFTTQTVRFSGILLLVFILFIGVSAFLISRNIARPLVALQQTAKQLAEGDLSVRAPVTRQVELKELANTFNLMADNVQKLTGNLETIVKERTEKLEKTVADLKKTQKHLVETEKLTALGQLSMGIAHELNTPLGAIQSSNRSLIEYLQDGYLQSTEFIANLSPEQRKNFSLLLTAGILNAGNAFFLKTDRSQKKSLRLELEKRGIEESRQIADYMAELGFTLDSPGVEAVLSDRRRVEILSVCMAVVSVRQLTEVIQFAADKSAVVISALRSYTQQDEGRETQAVDVVQEIETVLTLMHNKLKYGITVEKNLEPLYIEASVNELSQVWINLIDNAAQAMQYKGKITISAERHNEWGIVSIIDSGPGIDEKIQDKIFDPFFTTKKATDGIGLGLDICRKIVEKYKGRIEFDSRPGNTRFSVFLPLAKE